MMSKITTFKSDNLLINIYNNRKEMGYAAARDIASKIKELLSHKDEINMVFAAAPSQDEFLEELTKIQGIQWHRINAFHLDEYIGLPEDAPQRFGRYLYERIFSKVPFKTVNYLNGNAEDIKTECERYGKLIKDNPIDIACIGIGENGHIAFNDPHVADFHDRLTVKKVNLDMKCRLQQVHDGCFTKLEDVPEYALTMTVPAIFSAEFIFCIVPGKNKAVAVKSAVESPISEKCPASILRKHSNAVLYLDEDSASDLNIVGN
ncbi:MAG: glucosamine-6-phosphate deaminase [Thermoanaerobacteraceae bacterium]|jgi:glucosamine-6-phosphate deaminase|uniref:Glucosamine-6-phosphate deaminase n=2 Tax=Biomaibacter acetigenes TaxID=2316383 RepID=A0A3G2R6R3_9FIRM|nr:glucosamine-6-phosphate deaminase [Biomaibacter acetigenes]AYO31106.1 glucosamine-6-phosphate deaminase [Biomaibacter acetigenes]MDK2880221.1 glucosamine-6-phosphate deaminase [Thermoanaerobacteraceae bacterium]MDN5313643.1 glucosamine-6-phosphate deaminase [Thermoanaerobacteraceae bacterium]RKL63540.1 glucosamine-6-phosphate deaminase [Thermoanaerobacteraceae bacterium SP2]